LQLSKKNISLKNKVKLNPSLCPFLVRKMQYFSQKGDRGERLKIEGALEQTLSNGCNKGAYPQPRSGQMARYGGCGFFLLWYSFYLR